MEAAVAVAVFVVMVGDVAAVAARCGAVQYGMVRYGTLRYGTVRYGTVRYGTVRHGTVRCGTVRYGTRCGAVRCGAVRCGADCCCCYSLLSTAVPAVLLFYDNIRRQTCGGSWTSWQSGGR